MAAAPYRVITLNDRFYLMGRPVFNPGSPYGLKVGDSIVRVGNPPESKTNYVDEFTAPMEFVGTIVISGYKYIGFKVNPNTVKQLKLTPKLEPLYILYLAYDVGRIFSSHAKKNTWMPYRPVFIKEEIEK